MASIKGIQIKGLKRFRGGDWEGAQGNICIDGVKSGWYNDAGSGGMADIDLYVPEDKDFIARDARKARLEQAVQDYFKEHPLEGDYAELEPNVELFFNALLSLMDDEKEYKKMLKQGYQFMVIYKENERSPYERIIGYQTETQLDKFLQAGNYLRYRAYRTIDDFIIK